jgi:lysophospholipase L1-like esterase
MILQKKRIIFFSVVANLLLLSLIFLIGEIITRWDAAAMRNLIRANHPELKLRDAICTASNNPRIIYEYRPNTPSTNSQGYADEEHSFLKKPGVFRIVVIGDSIAYGDCAGHKLSFPEQIETIMNDQLQIPTEVIVLARGGYSLSQELEILKDEAGRYSPDLLLWSYCLNDLAHPLYHISNGEMGPYFYKPKSYFLNFLDRKLFYLREQLQSMNHKYEGYHHKLHRLYKRDLEKGLKQIGKWSKNNNIPVVLLIHPVFEYSLNFNRYSYGDIHQSVKKLGQSQGIYVLDILTAFKKFPGHELHCSSKDWFDIWHTTPKGHAVIADYVVQNLNKYRFLNQPAQNNPSPATAVSTKKQGTEQ